MQDLLFKTKLRLKTLSTDSFLSRNVSRIPSRLGSWCRP